MGEPGINAKFTKEEIKFLIYVFGGQILAVFIGVQL